MKTDYRTAKGKALRQHEREVERHKLLQILVSVAILTFFAFTILTKTLYDLTHPSRSPSGMIEKVEVVKAAEPQKRSFCNDVVNCIRDVGEELGESNNDIMTMIRISKKESNHNPRAKNRTSSASGVFQIIAGTWYSNDCVGDKWNAEDNIRCAYEIHKHRGFQPWEVCTNGSVKCQ